MTESKPRESGSKVKKSAIPFGIKLALIVSAILLGAIWSIAALTAFMVSSEFVRTAGEANLAFNNRAASGVDERLHKIRSEALLLMDIAGMRENTVRPEQFRNVFFERNPEVAALVLPGKEEITNPLFMDNNGISSHDLNTWLFSEAGAIERARAGEPVLQNVSPFAGINLLALFYPWQNGGFEEAVIIFFSPQSLSEITSAGPSTTLVVNDSGDILVSPDFSQVLSGGSLGDSPLFLALRKAESGNINTIFSMDGGRFIGAGRRISLASAAVISTMDYSLVNEQINSMIRRNILISAAVLFLTILVTWFFSRTVSTPIKEIIAAADLLESGEFNLNLKRRSGDEVGLLTERFNTMGKKLGRLAEFQNLFGRFGRQDILDKAMAGEINLEGEYTDVVILSASFASFYNFSRELTAKESLELLNSFISIVTENVEKTGGVTVTFAGTRTNAVWGIPPPAGDLSDEVMNCLQAVLEIRKAFWDINAEREKQGKPFLRVYFGVHSGTVLAGAAGTSSFREYSLTGRILDYASRCADLNRLTSTDIIISRTVHDLAGGRILAEELTIPGLPEKEQLFGLVNIKPSRKNEKQHWPLTLMDVRESLRINRDEPTE